MKTIILSLLASIVTTIGHTTPASVTVHQAKQSGPVRHPPLQRQECTFSTAITLNILGQEASISCSSSQPSCDAAINDVVRCVKLAKTRLQHALNF